jgi:hypothetical protein
MLRVIHDVGLAGGLVFEWADEWFKFSWNTIRYELPADRRALWDNSWTNEAQFGVLAVEAGPAGGILLGGGFEDWDAVEAKTISTSDTGPRVRAHHDPGYLYLLVELDEAAGESVVLGFDVVAGESGGLPGAPGVAPEADVAFVLGPDGAGEALTRASNDPFGIRFGVNSAYFAADPADYAPASNVWNLQRLLTSHPLEIPTTGEQLPAESFDVGKLTQGSSDPVDPAFDSRSTWHRSGSGIELRVSYAALGISDPSSRQALVVAPDGTLSTAAFDRIGITLSVDGAVHETSGYTWDPWPAVEWHERLRLGSDQLAATVREVAGF